jgi:hypothetical protein
MALRFHLPWAGMFTALGYSTLAAGAAWLHAVDYVGHLYLQIGLNATGGLILGAAAWAFNERVADAANLHTKPILRLTLAGVAASYAGAWVASPYIELTAGTQSVIAPLLSVILYVAAGILPVIAALALLSFFETVFAAQRGGGDVTEAIKPVLSYAALGLVLGTITVAVGIMLREEVVSTMVTIAGDKVRSSGWLDRRRALFIDVLRGSGCEVLVIPMEAAAAVDGETVPALDRPARSLITRQLAAQIHAHSGLCVLDPTLVARALGENVRELRATQPWQLADAAGASWVVRANAELDAEQRVFSLTLSAFSRGGTKGAWVAGESVQLGPISYSDDLPPEVASAPALIAAVAQLGLPAAEPAAPDATQESVAAFPESPLALVADVSSPTERARRLQLLAACGGGIDTAPEHLWERAWIALRDSNPADETVRLLTARAARHLHRRPYALRLLHGLSSVEARFVHALAQGNLTSAEALIAHINGAGERLIAELELEDARVRYGHAAGASERRDALLKQYPAYSAVLYPALSGQEWFASIPHELVQQQLIALGVPVQDNRFSVPLREIGSYFGEGMLASTDMSRHAAAIERSYAPLWRTRAAGWRQQIAFDRLAEWDYYDALYAANRLALASPALSVAQQRSQAGAAVEAVRELSPVLAGYPPLAAAVVWALHSQQRGIAKSDLLLDERERRLTRDLLVWEGGETATQHNVQSAASESLAYADEPPRAWRLAPAAAEAASAEQDIAERQRMVNYAQYEFRNLSEVHQRLSRAGRTAEAQQLSAQAQERFIGSPEREAFLLAIAEDAGDTAAYAKVLEQSLAGQPREWSAYYRLARAQLADRHPDFAQRTLLSFPLFHGEEADVNTLAANAELGGELLLDAGESQLAHTLFELSAHYAGESPAQRRSRLRLAQQAGQWTQVRDTGRELYERDKDAWGVAYASNASFLIGEADEGFRIFFEGSKQIEDMRPWWAALAGHRIAATPEDELIGFARRWKALSGKAAVEHRLRHHFLFNALMIDRAAADKTVQELVAMNDKSGDALYKAWVAGYAAFKRNNAALAADTLLMLVQDRAKAEADKSVTEPALPYVVASLARANRGEEARALLESWQQKQGRDFHVLLARAYMQGLSGDTGRALTSLWQAHFAWPALSGESTVPAFFQILETCEKLHEWTGDERYRVMLIDLARRQRAVWPWPWAYSFEAKHAKDAAEREHALGMASFVDPQSEHLIAFSKAQREIAAAAWQRNAGFKGK